MSRRAHTRGRRALCGLSLAAVLLGLPVPALAGDLISAGGASDPYREETPAAGFDLRLAEVLAVEGPRLYPEGSVAADRPGGAPAGAPEIRLPGFGDPHPLADQAAEQVLADQATPQRKKGVGRWLKKHWYVPVLAAIAVGVAIDQSGGDSDATGEED